MTPEEFRRNWTPTNVNRCLQALPLADQIDLARTAVEWAQQQADPAHPVSKALAGAKADLLQALDLLPLATDN